MSDKKVAVFLAPGFEEIEALSVVDFLRRADIVVDMIAVSDDLKVVGAHEIPVHADLYLSDIENDYGQYDLLVLPGGLPGATNLRDNEVIIELIQNQIGADKYVAAICAAPIVLAKAGLTAGRKGTSYPGYKDEIKFEEYSEELVVQDGKLITSRGPGTAIYFALHLIEVLLGKEKRDAIADGLLIPIIEEKIKST
ncbi:MAG: DJ-1/PfpI family protein [Clostridiaceae bacterium]|nr:DJ-1/PfpI family protein [Clostridiaceae bacterium]